MKQHATPPAERLGTLPPDTGIPVGRPAPGVLVRDALGSPVRLDDAVRTHSETLIVFYRGGWCPYCNYQIHELTTAYSEFQKRGIAILAISVDRAEEAARTQATYEIPFPVLADPDLEAHRAFRVTREVGDEELARLKGMGMDLERSSGQTHHQVAVPAMFLVDSSGLVRWAHADHDYKVRPSVAQILAAIDRLLAPER